MRFIHVADMHFDSPFTVLSEKNLGDVRRLEQRKVFKKMIEYIKQEEIPFLFIAGDLYEENYVKQSTIEYINDLFKTIEDTKIFISPGNHDPLLKNSFYNTFNWNQNVHIFNGEIGRYEFPDVDIYGFGFTDFHCTDFRIEDIEIENKETRMYINRCLGNVYMTHTTNTLSNEFEQERESFKKSFAEALEFWTNEEVKAHDADFPWDAFTLNAHQNICIWIAKLRTQPESERDMDFAQKIYESYQLLSSHDPESYASRRWPVVRSKYTSIGVRWCAGKLSHEETLNEYQEIIANFDEADYSEDGIFVNLTLSMVVLQHLGLSKKNTKQESRAIALKILRYCKNIPEGLDKLLLNRYLVQAVRHFIHALSFDEYLSFILELSIYSQLATHVHSAMVQELSQIIASYFMKSSPEYFIGLLESKNTADVLDARAEILDAISLAALCHDIGKAFYIDIVLLCSRSLYDFEFDIIKEHINAAELFKPADAKAHLIADVVGGHHYWYNEEGGYGSSRFGKNPKHKFVINLVSVADSIDAATDHIGRGYSQTKNLETVICEIKNEAGTRYNPIIAKALCDPALVEKLENCLSTRRSDLYFEAYNNLK